MMTPKLKSELIQLLAVADRESYYEARGFLLKELDFKPITPQNFTSEAIRDAVIHMYEQTNSRIHAIKLHRTLTGSGLRESKDYVDSVTGRFDT